MKNNDLILSKILSAESLDKRIKSWKKEQKAVVFTNGCFDILHKGHIHLLSTAADFGDTLIVGLNSDESVRGLKGESRPIQKQQERAMILASLFFVDAVVIFNELTPINLIQRITPNILVKGGDYELSGIVGADWVTSHNGKVEIVKLLEGYSTSGIVKRF